MPYIELKVRPQFDAVIDVDNLIMDTPGELNYLITRMLIQYLHTKGHSYQQYNECVGVLECAKQELYRRRIAPYEDKKIKDNGDVY